MPAKRVSPTGEEKFKDRTLGDEDSEALEDLREQIQQYSNDLVDSLDKKLSAWIRDDVEKIHHKIEFQEGKCKSHYDELLACQSILKDEQDCLTKKLTVINGETLQN
mmetsp:Transcript_11724/g.11643  ORF Transcript_11724/g.11643 Transcript_11724/m.11643 type:complete len:107 (+) Transcript_11724:1034-1354(+)